LFDGANATWKMGTTLFGLLTSQSSNDDDNEESDRDDDGQ